MELMVLLALIAVVVTLAIPSYRFMISKTRIRVATEQLIRVITQAREMAIHYQAAVIVCPSHSGIHCERDWSQGQLIALKQSSKGLSASPELPQGVKAEWRSNLGHNQFLEFGPQGIPQGQWGSFWLFGEEQLTARIILNSVGHLQLLSH